jgi:hypothetical protein
VYSPLSQCEAQLVKIIPFTNSNEARSLYILGSNVVSPERLGNVAFITVGLPECDL